MKCSYCLETTDIQGLPCKKCRVRLLKVDGKARRGETISEQIDIFEL
jgi:hypothetical protein